MSNPDDWTFLDVGTDQDECPHNGNVDYQYDSNGDVVGFHCRTCGFTTDW